MDRKSKKDETGSVGYRKNPQAPRRFKSPYILFSISKMQEFKHLCKNTKVTNFSSQISKEWKALSERERETWKLMAAKDKIRYDNEKRNYTGPWMVRSDSTRKKRPKDAPKRPPSAFLNYCQRRRSELKLENPGMKNTEISKLLGEEWKNCPIHIRQPHIDKERREREFYHKAVAMWRQSRMAVKESPLQLSPDRILPITVHNGQVEAMTAKLHAAPSSVFPMNASDFPLSPRELLPIAPKEPEKGSPPLSLKAPLGIIEQVDAPAVPGWKSCASIQYVDAEESLIPTILPAADPPPRRDFLDTDRVSGTKVVPAPIDFPLPSDHNLVFPNIFQGDTAFDPPIS